MVIPHQFPSLTEGPEKVIIIAGTGFSAPNAPTVMALKPNLDQVANNLGLASDNDFYKLAEDVLIKLAADGKSDPESRLWLAEKLGLLDDRQWFSGLGLPLLGNTPRHRALARFVVEEKLHAIVSLNWDALLESALDSVGLTETGNHSRPWKITKYARAVDNTDIPLLNPTNVFPVLKPHGCVRNLKRIRTESKSGITPISVIFKLTKTEMDALDPSQNSIVDLKVKGYLSECPLIGIGWSASEGYLRNAITEVANLANLPQLDSFALIDLKWSTDHDEIASAYGKDENVSFAQVSEKSLTIDCLMQWLQACHALKRMIMMAPSAEQLPLEELLLELNQPECDHPVQSWADHWLPTWVRICWRAGAMKGFDEQTNKEIGPDEIPVIPRDAHIPLTGMAMERRDLHAAAKLLVSLPEPLDRFKFDQYPGGILDTKEQFLYLPLPGWKATELSSDLAALKPLVGEFKKNLGYVKKIYLILLNNQDVPVDLSLHNQIEAQFRSLMPLTGFASSDAVSWIGLDELMRI